MSEDAAIAPPPLPRAVLPFGYTPPIEHRRPGIITAIGVVSIVVASLGMVASIIGGIYAIALTVVSTAASSSRFMAASSVSVSPQPPSSDEEADVPVDQLPAGPRGFDSAQRLTVVDALSRIRPMSSGQRDRLTQLLAKAGKDILPFAADRATITSSTLSANVSDSGQLPSASPDRAGPVYFIVGAGKIEVSDDRAAFFPSERGADVVRVARGVPDAGVNVLSPQDIDAVVARIETLASATRRGPVKLTSAQVASITKELASTKQTMINVGGAGAGAGGGAGFGAPAQQISWASIATDGSVVFQTFGGITQIDSAGTVIQTGGPGMPPALLNMRIRTSASVLTIAESILSGLLSVYLLICGILMLRQSLSSRRLHLIYAWLKLGVVVIGAFGWMWFVMDLTSGSFGVPGANVSGSNAVIMTQVFFATFLAAAYPIALLITLRTKTVREYFSAARA